MRQRSLELNEVNDFLELIVTSIGTAVAVLDREGVVRIWNSHARDLWGLRADEVEGRQFLGLDIGLPVKQLKQPLVAALAGDNGRTELTVEATSRRGKTMSCQVTMLPLGDGSNPSASGVLLLMGERDGDGDGDGA
jgi:two-component system CheB/CheR fusion protein